MQGELSLSQDVWGVHGMGGFMGTLLLGVLADPEECADVIVAPAYCVNPGAAWGGQGALSFVFVARIEKLETWDAWTLCVKMWRQGP